jgi:Mismatch repair ATPase (MutS family)
MNELTPMMRQYMEVKQQYPDCFLFYRLGDFYEMFFDDAIEGSKILELTLTGRDCGQKERAPMCGVPYHAVDTYVNKMISLGHKVAICEQMEDPALAKGLVTRSVTRVITPGTVIEEKMLDSGKNNYIFALNFAQNGIGYAYSDVSTGVFYCCEVYGPAAQTVLFDELIRLSPSEIVANETLFSEEYLVKRLRSGYYLEKLPDVRFHPDPSEQRLKQHFGVSSLKGYGLDGKTLACGAAGALLSYLEDTQKNALSHIHTIRLLNRSAFMQLDASTRRNLELTQPLQFYGNKKVRFCTCLTPQRPAWARGCCAAGSTVRCSRRTRSSTDCRLSTRLCAI